MAVPMRREPEPFEQEMDALREEVVAAFNRGDAKRCAGFYEEDATALLPDRPPVKGRAAIEVVLEELVASGVKLAEANPIEIDSSGDLGYCAGTYRFDVSGVVQTGKFVTILKRQADGSWKAAVDAMIRDSAAAP